MGLLVNGEWRQDSYSRDEDGRFQRDESRFRDWVGVHPDFPAEEGRYHLYVSLACPWAHRVLIMRRLKGLEHAMDVSVVHPLMLEDGWTFRDDFPGATGDALYGQRFLRELYVKADPAATGRVTVPVLWDHRQERLVNNESRELVRMFDHHWGDVARSAVDLAPPDCIADVDAMIDANYQPINNGVYRCGFATGQKAYEEAADELYEALDRVETTLGRQRYLCGDRLTEADVCLYTTLVRFDAVYAVHFKCSRRVIREYPNLSGYLRELYQMPAFRETTDFDHIRYHYYPSHPFINPTQIVAQMPDLGLDRPHGRHHLPVAPTP